MRRASGSRSQAGRWPGCARSLRPARAGGHHLTAGALSRVVVQERVVVPVVRDQASRPIEAPNTEPTGDLLDAAGVGQDLGASPSAHGCWTDAGSASEA